MREERRVGDRLRRRRELMLLSAAAVYGVGVFISISGRFVRPAPSDQAVGYLTIRGLDASAIFLSLPVLVVLTLLATMTARWLFWRFFSGDVSEGSIVVATASLGSGLWLAGVQGPAWAVALLPMIGLGLALFVRSRAAGWSVEDLILLPTAIATFFSLFDLQAHSGFAVNAGVAMLLVVLVRISVVFILPASVLAARSFALAPLAIVVQSSYVDVPVRSAGWPGLLVALATPLFFAALFRRKPRFAPIARTVIVWAVFPLVVFAYPSTRGIGYAENLPRVHMFENGHSLMPASEMSRGELPWRDVVPGHGLITDGLVDLMAMKLSDDRIGRILHWRWRLASLNSVVIYLLVLAATRSPEAGLGAFFLGYSMWGGPFGRSVPSLLAVAAAAGGIVRRNARPFVASGILLVISGLHSLDFCVYAGFAVTVAVLLYGRSWTERLQAFGMIAAGVGLATVPMIGVMLWLGILGEFLRTTFVEILPLGAVYSLGFPDAGAIAPAPWAFPEVVLLLLSRGTFPYLAWLLVLITASVLVALRKRGRPASAALVIAAWIVIAAISLLERHHLYFMFAFPAFAVTVIVMLWRSGRPAARTAAGWIVVALIAVAQPTAHLATSAIARTAPSTPSEGWSEYTEVRRARGALFREVDVRNLELVRHFIDEHLAENETFFDFADAAILYYLFDRPAPIRQYEVAFYQTEKLQREVISRLENDPSVRMAIFRFSTEVGHAIDAVPNEVRAPLVAQYLLENFEVALATEDVVLAVRKNRRESNPQWPQIPEPAVW
jgi:hypothetical protein